MAPITFFFTTIQSLYLSRLSQWTSGMEIYKLYNENNVQGLQRPFVEQLYYIRSVPSSHSISVHYSAFCNNFPGDYTVSVCTLWDWGICSGIHISCSYQA